LVDEWSIKPALEIISLAKKEKRFGRLKN
jgi:hypothetical protein